MELTIESSFPHNYESLMSLLPLLSGACGAAGFEMRRCSPLWACWHEREAGRRSKPGEEQQKWKAGMELAG